MKPFNLLSKSTHWVFISGSDENHDLLDIEFGLFVLSIAGVPSSNFHVFVDDSSNAGFERLKNRFSTHSVKTCAETDALEHTLKAMTAEAVVIVVTGHGNELGIHAKESISPYRLKALAHSINGIKYALIVLGQCYSGVFNFIEAEKYDREKQKYQGPRITLMGSTSFTTAWAFHKDSLILPDAVKQFLTAPRFNNWLVNFFLLHFFLWLIVPSDIDGDGHCSVMDAYKQSAVRTAECMLTWKTQKGLEIFQKIASSTAVIAPPDENVSPAVREVLEDAHRVFKELVAKLFATQEPWILNAGLARGLVFIEEDEKSPEAT